MNRLGCCPLLVSLFLLVPSGAALSPLEGRLRAPEPLEITGAIAYGLEGATYSHVRFGPAFEARNESFLEAGRVQMVLLRQESLLRTILPQKNPRDQEATFIVSNATLRPVAANNPPELFAVTEEEGASVAFETGGFSCQVAHALPDAPGAFPDDPGALRRDDYGGVREGKLWAACEVLHGGMEQPKSLVFYGLDLWLESDERRELIRTGTFEEAVVPGVPLYKTVTQIFEEEVVPGVPMKTVTQILIVRRLDPALRLAFFDEAEVSFYAAQFLAAGVLRAKESQGTIVWGPQTLEGDLPALQMTGEFEIGWSADAFVTMRGNSLEDPDPAIPARGPWLRQGGPWTPNAIAAVGAFALLLLLGFLFSRLAPDKLLDHSVRRRIYGVVRNDPGVETTGVARALGLRPFHAVYHVRKLVAGGYVVQTRLGGRTALFPAKSGFVNVFNQVASLRRPTLRRAYALIEVSPGTDQASLAFQMGVGQPAVSKLLSKLRAAGLVDAQRIRGRLAYVARATPGPGAAGQNERTAGHRACHGEPC